jgi:hypothetical protein
LTLLNDEVVTVRDRSALALLLGCSDVTALLPSNSFATVETALFERKKNAFRRRFES